MDSDEIKAAEQVPSQTQANAVLRVILGKPLKYTCRVHKADGSAIEWQSENRAGIVFNVEARALWVASGDYGNAPVMALETGMVILSEENPT